MPTGWFLQRAGGPAGRPTSPSLEEKWSEMKNGLLVVANDSGRWRYTSRRVATKRAARFPDTVSHLHAKQSTTRKRQCAGSHFGIKLGFIRNACRCRSLRTKRQWGLTSSLWKQISLEGAKGWGGGRGGGQGLGDWRSRKRRRVSERIITQNDEVLSVSKQGLI